MLSKVRILIIDDESAIRNVLRLSLESNGYQIKEAISGLQGIEDIKQFHPNLVILDLGLPDMGGDLVLKELRSWSRVPVIVLTVNDDEQVKVKLLDLGADDYLTKPFGTSELLARVRVALRNVGLIEATPIFRSAELEIDLSKKKVLVSGKEVKLTSTEFELLSRLVRDQGKVISQTQLLKQIWTASSEDHNHYLRIYINQLRKKLELDPSKPKHILTEPGVGYRIV